MTKFYNLVPRVFLHHDTDHEEGRNLLGVVKFRFNLASQETHRNLLVHIRGNRVERDMCKVIGQPHSETMCAHVNVHRS